MNRLENEVVLVTASTMGIGRAIATAAASEGASVVVTDRGVEKGEAVVDEIAAAGGEAMYAVDVPQRVRRWVDQLEEFERGDG